MPKNFILLNMLDNLDLNEKSKRKKKSFLHWKHETSDAYNKENGVIIMVHFVGFLIRITKNMQ